jgi:hypothetical protein
VRDFPHYRKLLAMGGVQPVDSFAALEHELDAYLNQPRRHSDERARTVQQECGIVDGQSSLRAANALLQILERERILTPHAQQLSSEIPTAAL